MLITGSEFLQFDLEVILGLSFDTVFLNKSMYLFIY